MLRSRAHAFLERVGRRRGNKIADAAVDAARALVRGRDGSPSSLRDFNRNGEANVLRKLGPELSVVFDVGANVGEWTHHALAAGAREVHAFEISPSTAATYKKRYQGDARVHVNTFGLGAEAGTVTIHHYPDHPTLTTITEYPHDARSEEIEVPVRTGDDYLAETGVERIDFLKLDVEGAEEFVIAGFEQAFARNAIRVVQFEYGQVSILTKYLLRDFYADMERHGFVVGRIGPAGVSFTSYDMSMETFADSNWLAVHGTQVQLIALVS